MAPFSAEQEGAECARGVVNHHVDLFFKILAVELLNSLIRKKMVKRKLGKTLNNSKPHLKHHKIYKTSGDGTHEAHNRAIRATDRSQCSPKTVTST
jgi:hypothetical protein